MKQAFVYHSSKTSGLKIIKPNIDSHNESWVYATKKIIYSVMFLGENSDFICQTCKYNGKPHIIERFKGALNIAYNNKSGSIYYLSSKDFEERKTNWSEEVVSNKPVKVEKEIIINNVLDYIECLEKKKDIIIYKYPKLPPFIPNNKEDIIEKAVNWTIETDDSILDTIDKFHKDILNKVIIILKEKKYIPKEDKWIKLFNNY